MSRSKSTTEVAETSEVAETTEDTSNVIAEVSDEVNVEESLIEETPKVVPEKKININKFLSLHPQSVYIQNLMKSKYKLKFYTETEWLEVLDSILNKKLK